MMPIGYDPEEEKLLAQHQQLRATLNQVIRKLAREIPELGALKYLPEYMTAEQAVKVAKKLSHMNFSNVRVKRNDNIIIPGG